MPYSINNLLNPTPEAPAMRYRVVCYFMTDVIDNIATTDFDILDPPMLFSSLELAQEAALDHDIWDELRNVCGEDIAWTVIEHDGGAQ